MKKLKKADRIIILVLVLIAVAAAILRNIPSVRQKPLIENAAGKKLTYNDYNGRKIGILTGTNMEAATFQYFPDSEYLYFDGYPNLNEALSRGIVDAYLGDEPALKSIHAQQPQIDYIRERLTNNYYSFAFRKDDPEEKALRDQFNGFLAKIKADGTYEEIDAIWFGTDESKKVVDLPGPVGKNGTLHVVTTSTDEPFSYIKDGKNVGYDIDVTARFCKEYGYGLEIGEVDFSARIPALASGRYEFTTTMNVTPEREESVLFSDPVSEGGIVVAVRSEDLSGEVNTGTIADYAGKTIGSAVGTTYDKSIEANIPGALISYFTSYGDMVAALEADRIDAFCADEPVVRYIMSNNRHITYLPEKLDSYDFGFAFPKTGKGKALCGQFSEFIRKAKTDGTMEELDSKWFGGDVSQQTTPDTEALSAENGILKMSVEPDNPPFVTYIDNEVAGYEIDVAWRFCKEYGYGLQFNICNFDSILPSLESGLGDFGGSGMTITEERKESVYFSEPHYSGGPVLAVKAADLPDAMQAESAGGKGFFEKLRDSFVRNFIRENRWKMIVSGLIVTCLITLLSALFGTVLAFLVCLFRRTDSVLAGKIADIYVKIMQGTPMVVFLMILYYVVFAGTGLSAVAVAVIGFALNFGAYVSEIMRSGIESVDPGQREAALALGFTERQAFFRFVFPQAAVLFLPVYRGELVSLLKSTAVVGYIAIQDLTKMTDIIRSRTYEAFFPLIATALIYFVIAWLLAVFVRIVLKQIDPRAGRKKKKGGAS